MSVLYVLSMDTRLLTYFQAVIEEGSISRAAASLHMTQPPLSSALSQLEKNLEVKLFNRTARGVVPTPAGQELAAYARETLTTMERMKKRLQNIERGGIGTLRLAAVFPYLWGPLPGIISQMVAAESKVDVSLMAPAPLEILNAVRRKTADLGVIAVANLSELEEKYGHELEIHPALGTDLIAALPHRFSDMPDPIDFKSLDSEPWLMVETTLGVRSLPELVRQAWLEFGVTPQSEQFVESVSTALPLIVADLGVTLLPSTFQQAFSDTIAFRSVKQELPGLKFAIVRDRTVPVTSTMKKFIELAASHPA